MEQLNPKVRFPKNRWYKYYEFNILGMFHKHECLFVKIISSRTHINFEGGIMLKNRNSIILLLLFLAVPWLYAQNLGAHRFSGSINSSGADGFVVANNGRQQVYQTNTIPANGLAIQNADMIQTGPGNYVEVQLDPSGAIIKLAENTSVIFNDLGSDTRPAFISFLYGRMRIVNQNSRGTVTIQSGNAAIEFVRGDMALDFAVIPGSANKQPQLQVSTLSGTGQIVSSAASPGAAKTPIYEHETVIFDVTTRLAVVTRQPLNQEIAAFWSRNGFRQIGLTPHSTYLAQGNTPSMPALGAYPAANLAPSNTFPSASNSAGQTTRGAPLTVLPSATESIGQPGEFVLEGIGKDKATIASKNGGVLLGTILTVTGIAVQSLAHYNVFNLLPDHAGLMYVGGFVPITFGFIAFIATYQYLYKK
jgi:hypothetical protein